MKRVATAIISIFLLGYSCRWKTGKIVTQNDLNGQSVLALLWVQQAAEFKALCLQCYTAAKLAWDRDLQQKSAKPRAVIVDIDDTVLDNSPFFASLVGTDNASSGEPWNRWCRARRAQPVPGAWEFLHYVQETGGEAFYISNRKAMPDKGTDFTADTIDNLKAAGFPFADETHVLLRTDPEVSSKEGRRQKVYEKFRVVLIAGDSLSDFDLAFEAVNCGERVAALEKFKTEFGSRFILIPNPLYGAWEDCLYRFPPAASSAGEKMQRRLQALLKFSHKTPGQQ